MARGSLIVVAFIAVAAPLRAQLITVNTRQTNAQCNPSVAAFRDGQFVVVWSSYYSSSGRSNEIMARRFDSTGSPLETDEFQVNTTDQGNQTEPAVAARPDGSFVVVWQGPGDGGVDIYGRLFDPNGQPEGDEFRVSALTPGRRALPRVAVAGDGSFVVVWEDSDADDTGLTTVWGQLFDILGGKIGDQFLVAADIASCRYADVGMDDAGNFVVVWLLDRTSKSVWGRRFDVAGLPRSEPFQISQDGISSLTRPSLAVTSGGSLVVTWDGDPNLASLDRIWGCSYSTDGVAISEPFAVSPLSTCAQQWPRVAAVDANDVVFVWQRSSNEPDGSTSIWARRFNLCGCPASEPFALADIPGQRQRYPDAALTPEGTLVAAWESDESGDSDYDIRATTEPLTVWPNLTGDRRIDFADLSILSLFWGLPDSTSPADLNSDGLVDAADLGILCCYWLQ